MRSRPQAQTVHEAAALLARARTSHWQTLRTDRLLVLAGPPCAGKTTLVSRMRGGAVSDLCNQIGYGDPHLWTHVDAADLARLSGASIHRLFLHYDFLAQRSEHGYKYLPDILSRSAHVVIVTLWTSPDVLRRRSRLRLVEAASSLVRDPWHARVNLRQASRLWKRHRVLRSPAAVRRHYQEWLEFSSSRPVAAHWVIDTSTGGGLVAEPVERWR